MKILILDNYDSFTYNLLHYVQEISSIEVDVFRNDKITIEEIEKYSHIILSPGPGLPKDAGIMCKLIRKYGNRKKILGVCLGHQAIAEVYGARLENMQEVMHGISSQVEIVVKDEKLFSHLPSFIEVGHYHSWVVSKIDFPDCLIITSQDGNGSIMSFKHKIHDVQGIQFHPESILTPNGKEILRNWLF